MEYQCTIMVPRDMDTRDAQYTLSGFHFNYTLSYLCFALLSGQL